MNVPKLTVVGFEEVEENFHEMVLGHHQAETSGDNPRYRYSDNTRTHTHPVRVMRHMSPVDVDRTLSSNEWGSRAGLASLFFSEFIFRVHVTIDKEVVPPLACYG